MGGVGSGGEEAGGEVEERAGSKGAWGLLGAEDVEGDNVVGVYTMRMGGGKVETLEDVRREGDAEF